MKRILELGRLHENPGTVCFTGPRPAHIFPQQPYDPSRRTDYQKIIEKIKEMVLELYGYGYSIFLSGGAQGFDQLAFWAVHSCKREIPELKNIVVRPFEGQERKWSRTGLFSQKEYEKMLLSADLILTCTKLTEDTKADAAKALHYRNQVMVTLSRIVIGMGEPEDWEKEKIRGGTGNCLKYAKEQKKQIIVRPFREDPELWDPDW